MSETRIYVTVRRQAVWICTKNTPKIDRFQIVPSPQTRPVSDCVRPIFRASELDLYFNILSLFSEVQYGIAFPLLLCRASLDALSCLPCLSFPIAPRPHSVAITSSYSTAWPCPCPCLPYPLLLSISFLYALSCLLSPACLPA